jgi:hypothetical protein
MAPSGDFLADAKIAWRDAFEMRMRAAVRPLQQAAEGRKIRLRPRSGGLLDTAGDHGVTVMQ